MSDIGFMCICGVIFTRYASSSLKLGTTVKNGIEEIKNIITRDTERRNTIAFKRK
jgi:hypothetical protein